MDCHDAQEFVGKEIAAHESAVRDLRAPRNTHAGISRLPIEVLSDIFLLAKLPYGNIYLETRENRGWLNVAGVCRSWRDIALSTPRMWDTLDTSKLNTLDWAATVIARSKNVPLYVSCTYPHPQTVRAVLDFVLSHMPRIRGLEVYMNNSTDVRIQDIIDMGSTQCALRTLTLYNQNSADNGGVDEFLAEVQMPHLRTLEVRSFTLPSTIPMLPQLSHLYYTSPLMSNSNSNTTVSQMLSFLRGTPSLERLEIVGSFGASDNGNKECTTVELTKLSFLSYTTARFEHASLFRFLHYPPSSRVKFLSRSSPSDTTTCVTELASIFTCMASSDTVATIETVSLAVMDGHDGVYFEMRISSHEGLMLEIEFPVVGGEMIPLLRLPVMLPCSGAHTLLISGFRSAQVADWASFFTRHGQIRDLTAAEVDSNFFRALLKPSETEPPPFMCLEHLVLRFCDIRDSDNAALVEQILKERRNLEAHVDVTLKIWDCRVAEDSITRLEAYANIEWDGGQRFIGDSEEDNEDEDEDDSDEDVESDGDDSEDD